MSRADGRTRVYNRRWERYASNYVHQVHWFGDDSVVVWGGIQHGSRMTPVHVAGVLSGIRYRNEITQH